MTVRIKKDGQAEVVEADDACKLEAIKILDEMLEDYVGIRDKVSIQIYLERVLFCWNSTRAKLFFVGTKFRLPTKLFAPI